MSAEAIYADVRRFVESAVKGEEDSLEVVRVAIRRVSEHKKGFWSYKAPDSDKITFIAFLAERDNLYFYAENSDGGMYLREVPKDEWEKYVFVPGVYDFDFGRISSPVDIIERGN